VENFGEGFLTDPTVIADDYVASQTRRVVRRVGTVVHVERVGNIVEVNIWPQQDAFTDDELGDGRVQNVAVAVDEGGGADAHVDAVVDVDWRLDVGAKAGRVEVLVRVADRLREIRQTCCRSGASRVQIHGSGAGGVRAIQAWGAQLVGEVRNGCAADASGIRARLRP